MNNTDKTPRVTALVPCYNGEATLALALDSALSQTYDDFEVVVVNDGSTDRSGEIAHHYAAVSGGRVRVVDQPNAGLPAARNAAIEAGRGEFFALLDADDLWMPQHLERAVAALDARPEVGLVHGNVECIDGDGNSLGVDTSRTWRAGLDAYRVLLLRHEHVCCPSAVFRRECVERVGAFDVAFTGLGCEDRDLWLRIAEHYELHYIDEVVVRYRIHAASMSRNRERMLRARLALIDKVAKTPRGARLARHAKAMVESDLGMEFLEEGDFRKALRAQLRALRIRPQTAKVWRRVLRPAASLMGAVVLGI